MDLCLILWGLAYILIYPGVLIPLFMWGMRRELIRREARKASFGQHMQTASRIKDEVMIEGAFKWEIFKDYTAVFSLGERVMIGCILVGAQTAGALLEPTEALTVIAGWVGLKFAAGWNDGQGFTKENGTTMDHGRLRQERHLSLMGSIWSMIYCYHGSQMISSGILGS